MYTAKFSRLFLGPGLEFGSLALKTSKPRTWPWTVENSELIIKVKFRFSCVH